MEVVEAADMDELNTQLIERSISAIIEMPAGFQSALLSGKAIPLEISFLDDYANDGILETTEEGYLRLSYKQMYNDYLIYGNFIDFLVTGNGIWQVEMQYGEVLNAEDPREICAPDEALLSFIQHLRFLQESRPVIIDGMDLIYYQEEFSAQEDAELSAVPYYRVFIQDNYVPFLINAYTNVCIN